MSGLRAKNAAAREEVAVAENRVMKKWRYDRPQLNFVDLRPHDEDVFDNEQGQIKPPSRQVLPSDYSVGTYASVSRANSWSGRPNCYWSRTFRGLVMITWTRSLLWKRLEQLCLLLLSAVVSASGTATYLILRHHHADFFPILPNLITGNIALAGVLLALCVYKQTLKSQATPVRMEFYKRRFDKILDQYALANKLSVAMTKVLKKPIDNDADYINDVNGLHDAYDESFNSFHDNLLVLTEINDEVESMHKQVTTALDSVIDEYSSLPNRPGNREEMMAEFVAAYQCFAIKCGEVLHVDDLRDGVADILGKTPLPSRTRPK